MSAEMVAQVRRFNRTVTQRIGVLNENFLASDRSLGQNRLLWEIGADGCDIRSLRARLDLDSGYVSRLLRALEAGGLIAIEQNATDGRVRTARLTATGCRELDTLDRRSDEAATAILQPPRRPAARIDWSTAMEEVERLLITSTVDVRERDPRDAEARFCLQTYYSELAVRFHDGYDPAVSPVADTEMTSPAGTSTRRIAARRARRLRCADLLPRRRRPGEAHVGGPFRPRVGPRPPIARRTGGPRPRPRCAPHAAGDKG